MRETGHAGPEVGTLSADGSRMWDGSFWVLTRNGYQVNELPPLAARRQAAKFAPERPDYRLGRVVLAATVGLTLSFIPIPAPRPGSVDAALTELAVVTLLRVVFTFVAVVVILSLGRQGIDVLVLRAMLTTFLMGAAFIGFSDNATFARIECKCALEALFRQSPPARACRPGRWKRGMGCLRRAVLAKEDGRSAAAALRTRRSWQKALHRPHE